MVTDDDDMWITKFLPFISLQTIKYNIDSTHGLPHSLNTFYYAKSLWDSEPRGSTRFEKVVYASALLHDMCDSKYMDKEKGVEELRECMKGFQMTAEEVDSVLQIVSTMSYSYVMKNGIPDLGELQEAYTIVREADLLTSYDVERSILFHLHKLPDKSFHQAFINAEELFQTRVFLLRQKGHFQTEWGKQEAQKLEELCRSRLEFWRSICALN
jgi:HD superfamily phosphodiesterase